MLMMRTSIGLVLLIALCCTVPATAKRLKPKPELVRRPTKAEIQVGSLHLRRCKDAPAYCGILSRPLDPSGTVAGSINVGFQFYPHLDSNAPHMETIVAAEGGPGYSTTGTRHSYIELFRPFMDRHDLLLMDLRGTGISQPLDCHLLQSEPNPQPEGIAACGAQLGKAAYLYSGVFAADDLAAILDALAIPQIDLYGDSYGTISAKYSPPGIRRNCASWCWIVRFRRLDHPPGTRRLHPLSAKRFIWLATVRARAGFCRAIRAAGLKILSPKCGAVLSRATHKTAKASCGRSPSILQASPISCSATHFR